MDCPVCHKPMKKIAWRITSNGKDGKAHNDGEEYKEYDHTNYKCEADDVWLDVEIPIAGA